MNRRRLITLLLVVAAIAVAFALPAFAEDAAGEEIRAKSMPPFGRLFRPWWPLYWR